MDLNAIKAKLTQISSQGQEKPDYSKIIWKPKEGDHTVRIVPSMFNPAMPFTEVKFHYGIGKYPMLALSNFGEQDPVEDFVKELRKTSDKDNWSLSAKLSPKTRFFVPVIVRGEEDQGVRLWSFGITIYKALLQLAADEEIGDFTDVMDGTDLKVTITPGNPYPDTTIRPKRSSSPLSADAELVKKWLKEQPNPLESFRKYDYDFIKGQLENFLSPKPEDSEPKAVQAAVTQGVETIAKVVAPVIEGVVKGGKKATKNPVSSFDDLFGGGEEKEDQLPF